jgi:hypothetical protein
MIEEALNIEVELVKHSRINQLDPNNISFGALYTDHMCLLAIFL